MLSLKKRKRGDDIMTQGERIRELRKALKLTLDRFGERVGVKKSALSQIENGKSGVTDQMIKSICREFDVSETWIRTGEGEMFPPVDRRTEIARLTRQLLNEEEDSFKNRFISILADLSVEEWEFLEKRAKQLYEGTCSKTDDSEK
jgi:transcriptional regulator with XRE-family HTH domain